MCLCCALLAPNVLHAEDTAPARDALQWSGYAEVYAQYNMNAPENGITAFRGFDNRSGTITLSNVVLAAKYEESNLLAHIALQYGQTPAAYYASEPVLASGGLAGATGPALWQMVQQAYGGYRFDIGNGLLITAGLFLSPIGPESMAVRDNWNWSRSNLFVGLPFYHTGARAQYFITDSWKITIAGYNGLNSIVDNNNEKSLSLQLNYDTENLQGSVLYFGGVERPKDAPEGRAWRHLGDAHVTWHSTRWLSLLAHANVGAEPNAFGTSAWAAAALYARVQPVEPVFVAVRGDVFYERVASTASQRASSMFWPTPWVASATATLDARPDPRISLRLEYRHDHAAGDTYFQGKVAHVDGVPVANAATQDTFTIGAVAGF